ncbi:ROK family protein [Streptomyces boninensis]|uniref:ROK family protein n=1 Tax=Streptomyces boninensis TaxID=2039455 RepID=UPI003B2131E1
MIPVLEVGGTHVVAAMVDLEGVGAGVGPGSGDAARFGAAPAVRCQARRALDAAADADTVLGAVLRCGAELSVPPGAVWGVAVPGPFDYARGIALFEGVGKFDALHGVDVRKVLLHGLPGRPRDVVFLNDAHAFLLGEAHAGAAAGHRRAIGITLGTGVGSAFLADGELRAEGPGVPPEGRVDLLRINGRPLEDTVSRRAIVAGYAAGDTDTGAVVDVLEIAVRARAGEESATRILHTTFHTLGATLAPHANAFGATALVIGGSMSRSWDLVASPLRAGLGHTPVSVQRSTLDAAAPLLGAALAATRRVPSGGRRPARRDGWARTAPQPPA